MGLSPILPSKSAMNIYNYIQDSVNGKQMIRMCHGLVLYLVVLCVCLYEAGACGNRRDRHERHGWGGGCRSGRCGHHSHDMQQPSLGRWACKLVNAESREIVFEKTCGCPGEAQVSCDLGPLAFTGNYGEKLEVTFCNLSPNWVNTWNPWRGPMCEACVIQEAAQEGAVYDSQTCPEDWSCDLGPLPLTINGTSSEAYFCNPVYDDMDVLNWDYQCGCRRGYYDHTCVRLRCCGGEYGSCYQGDVGRSSHRHHHRHDYDDDYDRRSYRGHRYDDDDDDDDRRRRYDYGRRNRGYGSRISRRWSD